MAVLTMADRNRLRRLQDRIIAILDRRGTSDNQVLLRYYTITLADLRQYIYEQYERELADLLDGLRTGRY